MVVCYGPLSAQLEEYLSDIGLIAVKYKCLIFFLKSLAIHLLVNKLQHSCFKKRDFPFPLELHRAGLLNKSSLLKLASNFAKT